MAKSVIGDKRSPSCSYCAFGVVSGDGIHVLCSKFGISDISSSCKKFVYDPLRREPLRPAKLQGFSADDFKL